MMIVSGANSSHGESLLQFVASVRRFEPDVRLVVYDLGLSRSQRHRLENDATTAEIKDFDFSAYPDFFDINIEAGQYAWKPTIIWNEINNWSKKILWMDAGNVLRKPLRRLRREVSKSGFYSEGSNGDISTWTHPGMLDFLGLEKNWGRGLKNLNGSCVAFDPDNPLARSVAREWASFAMIKECIAPEGSSRLNHRQDQALLTVLAYRSGLVRRPTRTPMFSWQREFLIHQDID